MITLPPSITIEQILISTAVLLLLSLFASTYSGRLGIPALLIFLVIGMLAGSESIGGIEFDDPRLAQYIGVVALIFIIFAGGLGTDFRQIRHLVYNGILLSTIAVLLTALVLSLFAYYLAGFGRNEAFLLGAIVSSTDAAAVFMVLRSRKVSLKPHVQSLLEFEAGSNDPMAVFLTIVLTALVSGVSKTPAGLVLMFLQQLVLGALFGFLAGKGLVWLIRKVNFEYQGLYPVLGVSIILLVYGVTSWLGGSGFLAVYLAGLILASEDFIRKRVLVNFHDGLAWLMQIVMFLVLGLLVFPSELARVWGLGLVISLALMFIARPLSIFCTLAFSRVSFREKILVSWVGLRGAVPIVLATFPLLADVPKSGMIFDVVFFVVLTSTLIQGPSIPFVARWLKLDAPYKEKPFMPIEVEKTEKVKTDLLDILIAPNAKVIGMQIQQLEMPPGAVITLINRGEDFFVPSSTTTLQQGDIVLVLVHPDAIPDLNKLFDELA